MKINGKEAFDKAVSDQKVKRDFFRNSVIKQNLPFTFNIDSERQIIIKRFDCVTERSNSLFKLYIVMDYYKNNVLQETFDPLVISNPPIYDNPLIFFQETLDRLCK